MIIDAIKELKPDTLLDVGCGCGAFTKEIAPFVKRITAIDTAGYLIDRCKKEITAENINFVKLSGTKTGFADNSFDLVIARYSLHHSPGWKNMIREMLRVSKGPVLIEEPIDSERNEHKIIKRKAWDYYLDLQREIGEYHAPHFQLQVITGFLDKLKLKYTVELRETDNFIDFDDFFSLYDRYAKKSRQYDFRKNRLENFRSEIAGQKLCGDDMVYIEING